MKNKSLFVATMLAVSFSANAQHELHVTLENTTKIDRVDYPVVVPIKHYSSTQQAVVTLNGKEIASQLDDLDRDGYYDELCFLADIDKKQKQEYKVELINSGDPRGYNARTFAEIVLRNPKVNEKNKHDLYLSEITATKDLQDQYHLLHHHGVAFESELIGVRIYFDKRQTLDLYGKYSKQLEIKDTQFYTSKEQKENGFGDDVLWVGNTFGLGAFRGWDGSQPTMLDDVNHRTQRIIATGPVRTIVEVEDRGWKIADGEPRVNALIRYTLYGGHRDIGVDVFFSRNVDGEEFSTGLVNVKGSSEFSDNNGLRGCWGTAFPSSEKDSIDHPRETVGLGVYIPKQHLVRELDANADNYGYVIKPQDNHISYNLVYTSAKETFGFGCEKKWYGYLKEWRKELESPLKIIVNE